MNKQLIINIISYVSLITIGLLIGWLLFSGNTGETGNKKVKTPKAGHNHGGAGNTTIEDANQVQIWTCSMHPQIRQNEPGQCPICGMDLIPLDATGGDDSPIRFVMTPDAVKLAQIETTIVGNAENKGNDTKKEIFLTGKVKMNETNSSTQTAHIGGRIEEIFINYTGEYISKGQKIAKIYSPELVAAQKELLEAIKIKDEIPSLYIAAREKIKHWKLPDVMLEEIEKTGKVQTEVNIYSDLSGTVMKRYVEVGDYLKLGSPIAEIMNLNTVWVLFDVYEKDLQWVRVGEIVEFNLAAMPEKTYKARISFIDPIINPNTRVAEARVEILNQGGALKPDMFAKGILRARATKSGKSSQLSVPKSAVLWTGKRSVVYVQLPKTTVPTYEFREVIIATDLGNYYLIESGLEDGEEVVVNGAFRLDAAAQLNNKASMMNRLILVKGAEEKIPDYKENTNPAFKNQLALLIEKYLLLKDKLVLSNAKEAENAMKELQQQLSKIDMKLLKGDAHIYWMQQEKALQSHFKEFLIAKTIKSQRQQFSNVSELLIKCLKVFGSTDGPYYLQHCPMALDGKGANWLSKEQQILNPYFGDEMLSCGVVNDNIKN